MIRKLLISIFGALALVVALPALPQGKVTRPATTTKATNKPKTTKQATGKKTSTTRNSAKKSSAPTYRNVIDIPSVVNEPYTPLITDDDEQAIEWQENIKEKKADIKVTAFPKVEEKPKPLTGRVDENKVYTHVEQMPYFPGGDAAMLSYISNHIRYPQDALDDGIEGQVVVRFVVTKTGKVGEVQVLRGKHPSLDKEAVRLVKSLPAFTPGRMYGEIVNVWYTLPVRFELPK